MSKCRLIVAAAALWQLAMSPAGAEVYYDYAPVIEVTPVVRTARVPVTEQHCDEAVPESRRPRLQGLAGDVRARDPAASLGEVMRSDRQLRQRRPRPRRTCQMVTRYETCDEVVAYEVRYRYAGAEYSRQMDRDPGQQIRVRVELDTSP